MFNSIIQSSREREGSREEATVILREKSQQEEGASGREHDIVSSLPTVHTSYLLTGWVNVLHTSREKTALVGLAIGKCNLKMKLAFVRKSTGLGKKL